MTFAEKLIDTAPRSLHALAQAAVDAAQALSALNAADMPLPAENVLCEAENAASETRRDLLDWLLFEQGIGGKLASQMGAVL